jgi:hypothetical protein
MRSGKLRVASLTNIDVMGSGFFAALSIVRIVAGRARQCSGAFLKTRGSTQSVRLIHDLELVVMSAVSGVIEVNRVI